jgi:hypothetical protein
LQALEASTIMSKLTLECQQAICTLSNLNKVMLLWVLGYSGIQGNGDADAWLGKIQAVHFFVQTQHFMPPHVGRLKINEYLTKEHSKYWV